MTENEKITAKLIKLFLRMKDHKPCYDKESDVEMCLVYPDALKWAERQIAKHSEVN